jgi:hypothetical protein
MNRTSLILAAILSLGTGNAVAAVSDTEVRAEVVAYLSSIDTSVPRTAWTALGVRADPVLREIAASKDNLPTIRAKAIDGLAVVGGAAVAPLFRDAVRAESEPLVVRIAALRGLEQVSEPRELKSVAADCARFADARVGR